MVSVVVSVVAAGCCVGSGSDGGCGGCGDSCCGVAIGSLQVEEPVHTSWSRCYTLNHQLLKMTFFVSEL